MNLDILREDDCRIEGFSVFYFIMFQSVGGEGGIRTLGLFIFFNMLVGDAVTMLPNSAPPRSIFLTYPAIPGYSA